MVSEQMVLRSNKRLKFAPFHSAGLSLRSRRLAGRNFLSISNLQFALFIESIDLQVKQTNSLIIVLTFIALPFIISHKVKSENFNIMHPKSFLLKTLIALFLIIGLSIFINILTVHAAIRIVSGTVTKVSDGDTIHVTTPEQTKLRVRLYGIDAPETPKINHHTGQVNKPGQPYGVESWKVLEDKIKGKYVRMDIIDVDKYRRMVGIIWLGDRNINLEMVSEGYAEAFVEYLKPPYRKQFLEADREAKSARRGIWSLPDYERPRVFRKRLKISGGD